MIIKMKHEQSWLILNKRNNVRSVSLRQVMCFVLFLKLKRPSLCPDEQDHT